MNLIRHASAMMAGGDDVTLRADGELPTHLKPHEEYLRGMAELICESTGLPMDAGRPLVISQILDGANVTVHYLDVDEPDTAPTAIYLVRQVALDVDGSVLWWSNEGGYSSLDEALVFTAAERQTLNLPHDGMWVEFTAERSHT